MGRIGAKQPGIGFPRDATFPNMVVQQGGGRRPERHDASLRAFSNERGDRGRGEPD